MTIKVMREDAERLATATPRCPSPVRAHHAPTGRLVPLEIIDTSRSRSNRRGPPRGRRQTGQKAVFGLARRAQSIDPDYCPRTSTHQCKVAILAFVRPILHSRAVEFRIVPSRK